MVLRKIEAQVDGALWEEIVGALPQAMGRALVSSIQDTRPNSEAIKAAAGHAQSVPGAEVYRGEHLRVA
jgi:hypothetical protein